MAEAYEHILARHKLEQRDLQNRATALKKTATKGDKKRRKEVTAQIEVLERELRQKHLLDIDAFNNGPTTLSHIPDNRSSSAAISGRPTSYLFAPRDGLSEQVFLIPTHTVPIDGLQLLPVDQSESGKQDYNEVTATVMKKPSRQKARLAKRAAEMEYQRAEAALDAVNMPDLKAREEALMNSKLSSLGLVQRDVTDPIPIVYTDSRSMLMGIVCTLHLRISFQHDIASRYPRTLHITEVDMQETYKTLRAQAADYIRGHPGEFSPFIISESSNQEESTQRYADNIEQTAVWGGELEIIALARRHAVSVEVVQAASDSLRFEEGNKKKVLLARYDHLYSLGAHFNSLHEKQTN